MKAFRSATNNHPPERVLRKMLATYGLESIQGPNNTLLIVRNKGKKTLNAALAGRIINQRNGTPIPSARITIQNTDTSTESTQNGCFALSEIPQGKHTLTVAAEDYLSKNTDKFNINMGHPLWVNIAISPSPSPPRLEEIKVDGTRYQLFENSINNHVFLTREEIENIPTNDRGISGVIQHLPGIVSVDTTAKFNLRGGMADEVRTTIDGVELLDPFFIRDLNGGHFSAVDSTIIKSVDILTGGFSAEYGNAMSGFVNIDTAFSLAPKNKSKIGFDIDSGHFGRTMDSFNDGKGDYFLFLKREQVTGELGSTHYSSSRRPTYTEGFAKVSLLLNETTEVSANVLFGNDESNFQSSTRSPHNKSYAGNSKSRYSWLKVSKDWTERLRSNTIFSSAEAQRSRTAVSPPDSDPQELINERRTTTYLGIQSGWSYNLSDKQLLKAGFRLRKLKSNYQYSIQVRLGRITYDRPVFQDIDGHIAIQPEGYDYNGYFSYRSKLSDRWLIETGLRWDKQTYTKLEDNSQFSPRINVLFDITEHNQLRLAWGKFYQAQGINELQVQDGVAEFFPAQLAEHFVASFISDFSNKINFRADIYQKKYRHLRPRFENLRPPNWELEAETGFSRILVTADRAIAQGIELSLKHKLSEAISWWINYSYAEAQDQIADVDVPRLWDQPHALNLGLNWALKNWRLSLIGRYHTGIPLTDIIQKEFVNDKGEAETFFSFGPQNTSRSMQYTRIDYRLSRAWHFSNGHQLQLYFNKLNAQKRDGPHMIEYTLIGLEWEF